MKAVGEEEESNDAADADNPKNTGNCWDQTSFSAQRFANRIESGKDGNGDHDADESASRPRAENSNDSAEGNGPPEDLLKKLFPVQKEEEPNWDDDDFKFSGRVRVTSRVPGNKGNLAGLAEDLPA
jgi:hypothetical protein